MSTMASAEGTARRLARDVPNSGLVLFAFFIVNLVFLIVFCDRDGYEGDDLNSVVPMFHLDAAKQGALSIYRYAWQPLSYELGAALYRVTHWPDALFLLAPASAAVSLSLVLLMLWRDRKPAKLVASLVVMLAIPELWYSGLYFNSTVLGLPFALGALWLLRTRLSVSAAMLAGGLAGIAILMRLDFILACPALAVTAWSADRSFQRPFVLAAGVVTILITAALIGWLEPAHILQTYRESAGEIAAKSADPGWDLRTKLLVASVALSPFGWGLVLLGGPGVMLRAFRRDHVLFLAWAAAVAALALPVRGLLSVKYIIPLLMFAPFFLAAALTSIEPWTPKGLAGSLLPVATAASCLLLIFSFNLSGTAPYVRIGLHAARQVGTHDGLRSFGGYLWQVAAVDRYAPRVESLLAEFPDTESACEKAAVIALLVEVDEISVLKRCGSILHRADPALGRALKPIQAALQHAQPDELVAGPVIARKTVVAELPVQLFHSGSKVVLELVVRELCGEQVEFYAVVPRIGPHFSGIRDRGARDQTADHVADIPHLIILGVRADVDCLVMNAIARRGHEGDEGAGNVAAVNERPPWRAIGHDPDVPCGHGASKQIVDHKACRATCSPAAWASGHRRSHCAGRPD